MLTQHKGFVKRPMPKKSSKLMKKYPLVGEAIKNRHIMYNEQLEYVHQMEEQGKALVIQPHIPLQSGTLEKDLAKLESIYQLGYTQGIHMADEVKEFIKE